MCHLVLLVVSGYPYHSIQHHSHTLAWKCFRIPTKRGATCHLMGPGSSTPHPSGDLRGGGGRAGVRARRVRHCWNIGCSSGPRDPSPPMGQGSVGCRRRFGGLQGRGHIVGRRWLVCVQIWQKSQANSEKGKSCKRGSDALTRAHALENRGRRDHEMESKVEIKEGKHTHPPHPRFDGR